MKLNKTVAGVANQIVRRIVEAHAKGLTISPAFVFTDPDGLDHYISIQASDMHYSTPREVGEDWYTHVEIGPLDIKPDGIEYFAEDPENDRTVYPFVPIEIAAEVLMDFKAMIESGEY